ncbi:MAG: YdcF family protein [Acinetobacter sp.]|uniref:YdcF family protein n=1 Tax=Acinetobacter sp. TaxID=472 RepID=UPI003D012A5A
MNIKRFFLLLAGMILVTDSIWLLLQDKIHLGIFIPLILGIIFLIFGLFSSSIQKILQQHPRIQKLWRTAWCIFWIWLISLLIFFTYLQYNISKSADLPALKAIIVLGSGIENGHPSPTLQARLDAAATVALQQPHTKLIMTGGLGFKESISEAEVMQTYLLKHYPISAQRIYQEAQSTSTELNLINSQKILHDLNISLNAPIAIATSDFHLPRAQAIAKHLGYTQIYTISAPTPVYIRYNSWLREYFAYISGWVLNEY